MTRGEREIERRLDAQGWEPVIVSAVALLADEAPDQAQAILARLVDEGRDDVFRHRLVLAAQSLHNAGSGTRAGLGPVAVDVERMWAGWLRAWMGPPFARRTGTHRGLGRLILGAVQPSRLPDAALAVLISRIGDWEARAAIRLLGPAAASDAVFEALVTTLDDTDSEVSGESALTLALLGPRAATPSVLAALLAHLDDSDADVGKASAAALGRLGPAAGTQAVLSGLLAHLHGGNGEVGSECARALGQMGQATTPAVLSVLVSHLNDHNVDLHLRYWCAIALKDLGQAGAEETAVSALLRHLQDGDHPLIASRCADALGSLGPAVATEPVCTALVAQLDHEDIDVRWFSAGTLRRLSPTLAAEVADRGRARFHDPDGELRRRWVVDVLAGMGPAAATDGVIADLVRHMEHEPYSCAYALAEMGAAARNDAVAEALLARGGHPDAGVRKMSAEALGRIGARGEAVGAQLVSGLGDADAGVRSVCAQALGALGDASPAVLTALVGRLKKRDSCWAAARALRKLGPQAATDPVLQGLWNHRREIGSCDALHALLQASGRRAYLDGNGRVHFVDCRLSAPIASWRSHAGPMTAPDATSPATNHNLRAGGLVRGTWSVATAFVRLAIRRIRRIAALSRTGT